MPCLEGYKTQHLEHHVTVDSGFFSRRFRDPIQVPRIENQVLTIRENHHRVPRIKKNRVPIIREIGSLQVHIGYLTFSIKQTWLMRKFQTVN